MNHIRRFFALLLSCLALCCYGQEAKTVSFPLAHLSLSSPYGIRRDPLNRKSVRMHKGLDLKAHYKQVFAMLPGTVTETGYSKNGGYYVTINHGACICSFLHLSKIVVSRGEHVSAGSVVAISGASGLRCTGPHLHISCRYADGEEGKGKYFDPLILLRFIARNLQPSEGE